MTELDSAAAQSAGKDDDGTPLGLAALLAGTLVGTVSNNIVNVPLGAILSDFDAPLGNGVFVAVGFLVCFAAALPLAGWLGDRFGRRRVYCVSLIATAVCAVGAATAPTLPVLVAWRSVGGVAVAALSPPVMGLITWMFSGDRRGRALGAWASVNGLGQAVGPTVGGVLAGSFGWRWVFVPLVPVAVAGLIGTLRHVPRYPGAAIPFDLTGAVSLTVGSALLMGGVAIVPQPDLPGWAALVCLAAAALVLAGFVWHCLRAPHPFVDVRLVIESRFARSCLAAFAQMFCLGATLLAVPLYLVGRSASVSIAGFVLFALPATMALLAPFVGRWLDRLGPRRVLRSGLAVLAAAQAALIAALWRPEPAIGPMVGVLLCCGVGIALVQTPAATGATRSPAGESGTGLGLFNLVRFGGAAIGASWVAVALEFAGEPLVFAVTAGVAALGLAGSFVGPDPV
ncbi:multidrug efflux MFS transporter [Mycolicibacterium sp. 018/SC-01/001]|uniref:MFS transporter n=1 Tax=Mycolicibacterium sp. 018/SC-01/001 TaxID=2592069 RepID=UPI00117E78B4|nr:MFS transporter [Mycolicibacterium sp. 018/SC-01/001]TRW81741.1 multidrug efflux MFS transporter [Mycolicibacterium sp. 018/SC-01/001]